MKDTIIKKFLTICISVLLLVYVGCNIYQSIAKRIDTATIIYDEVDDSYETGAIAIKKENIIPNDTDKQFYYNLDDGDCVSGGETIAYMFDSPQDAKIQKEITRIENEIKNLEELNNKSASLLNPESIEQKIKQSISGFQTYVGEDNLSMSKEESINALYYMNEKQIAIGKINNFDEKIQSLKNEEQQLKNDYNPSVGDVISPASGYFVSSTDGFENYFDYNNIKDLDLNQLKSGLSKKATPLDGENKPVGKVIEGITWYVACVTSSDEASKLSIDKEIMLEFPMITNKEIPAKVVAINQVDFNSEAAIIFECDYMNKDLATIRNSQIKIKNDTYQGYRVPRQAVHIESKTKEITETTGDKKEITQNIQGVYVLYGNQLKFKEIIPLGIYEDSIICKKDPEKDELFTGETVKLYDEVVTGGTNLYDGKIIR